MTAQEVASQARGRLIRTGANHADFVADPNDPKVPVIQRNKEERADIAQAAANQRALTGERQEWLVAKSRLQGWTEAQAVDAIGGMPFRVMEVYLTVERAHAARQDILNVFPTPNPALAEQYAAMTADPKVADIRLNPAPTEVDATEEEVQAVANATESILGTADLGDAAPAEVTPAQTYDCIDCDFQGKTLAGLKAHERAKHGIGDDAEDVSTEPQAGE